MQAQPFSSIIKKTTKHEMRLTTSVLVCMSLCSHMLLWFLLSLVGFCWDHLRNVRAVVVLQARSTCVQLCVRVRAVRVQCVRCVRAVARVCAFSVPAMHAVPRTVCAHPRTDRAHPPHTVRVFKMVA